MVLCFIFEFCIRWTANAFDSRYGFYLTDKFGTTSEGFSYVFLVIISILELLLYLLVYWLVYSKPLSIHGLWVHWMFLFLILLQLVVLLFSYHSILWLFYLQKLVQFLHLLSYGLVSVVPLLVLFQLLVYD